MIMFRPKGRKKPNGIVFVSGGKYNPIPEDNDA